MLEHTLPSVEVVTPTYGTPGELELKVNDFIHDFRPMECYHHIETYKLTWCSHLPLLSARLLFLLKTVMSFVLL